MEENVTKDLELYDYSLPKELIAQSPRVRREDSRLMILLKSGEVKHDFFHSLSSYLEKNDTMVINNSKVLPAKLVGFKKTGGKVHLLVIDKISSRLAKALVKGRVRPGDILEFGDFKGVVKEKEKAEGFATIEFSTDVNQILLKSGEMPLPPYIKAELEDKDRYQTVFAKDEGSLAAPTAGLHFSSEIMDELKANGVNIVPITLHINIGTFFPVERGLIMPERFKVDENAANLINRTKSSGNRVFVVGTSTFKCLESACTDDGIIMPKEGSSSLFIAPPYEFKFNPDAFLTNFHLPKSSVLLLTCAYAGKDTLLKAYEEAVKRSYRFYSFGDSMLIFSRGEDDVQDRQSG